MTKINTIILSTSLLLASSSAFSCDNKSCEVAYLNSSKQYVGLQGDHALAAQQERIAYAKIREDRQKKVNEQLVREARANLILTINKAIAQGKSVEFIEAAVKAAYSSGSIKAQPVALEQSTEDTSAADTDTTEKSS